MHHPDLAYLRQIVKQSDPKVEYKVLANIGSGTYGDVYKAQRRDDRRLVAIKIMKIDPKDDIRAICQEIHTLMECSHPNIVQYYGSYLRLNKLWICMEFCGGQSMQDIYLYTRIPLQEDCIAFVTRETLKGLRHMHERNRIHRDIKAILLSGANILLTDRGEVKIADFGVAAKLSTSMIKRSTVIGTPYWLRFPSVKGEQKSLQSAVIYHSSTKISRTITSTANTGLDGLNVVKGEFSISGPSTLRMAPEVASVENRGTGYDGKCDIWAVGITAIEYAELQPPLFDLDPLMLFILPTTVLVLSEVFHVLGVSFPALHRASEQNFSPKDPFLTCSYKKKALLAAYYARALQCLGARNYKPPNLKERSKWSGAFRNFVKLCLTKNERNRPDASVLLTHLKGKATNDGGCNIYSKTSWTSVVDFPLRQAPMAKVLQTVGVVFAVGNAKKPIINPPGLISFPPLLPQHDFVSNPFLSIASTRDLLDRKCTLEEREKMALAATPAPLVSGPKIKVAMEAVQPQPPLPPPPIPQKPQHQQPQHLVAAEQPIWPVSVSRERPQSLLVQNRLPDRNGRPEDVDQANRREQQAEINMTASATAEVAEDESPPPQPPRSLKVLISAATSTSAACAKGAPRLRIASLRRPSEPAGGQDQPITSAGWPPGDHRLLPENCLNESSEDLVAEVLDEYEKRQSQLFYSPIDGMMDSEIEMVEEAGRLSFYESENFEDTDEFGGTNGLVPSAGLSDEGLSRMRSKRRAPLPPPLPPKGEALKAVASVASACQSYATAPGPIISTTSSTSSQQQQQQPMHDFGISATDTDNRDARRLSGGDGAYQAKRTGVGVPPPRPPPPKFDTACGLLTDFEKRGLRHAERQYQMEHGIGLPPTPKVHLNYFLLTRLPLRQMGACFTLIFEGCPLKVNATATWVNPLTKAQMIIFGTNDGIYYLNLQELADATLELLIPRRCIWLTVFRDTMMSLSGNTPHLYSHNLVNVMKAKTSQDLAGGTLTGRLPTKLLPKRFQPTVKVPNTRGCYIASVVRNPSNGNKYLCAVIDKSILVLEWFNPRSTFVEVKRVEVPSMPSPVYNFDLVCNRDQSLPTVCLGVYKTSDPNRFRLHVVDLNNDAINPPPYPFSPEDSLPIVKVAHIDYSVLMLCFQDHAKFVDFRGNVCSNRQHISKITFGTHVASVVCLRDGILAFHPFGLRGFGFDGQLTQDINDPQHIYQLLGSDKNIVVESRPVDDPMSKSNLYLLFGHENSY
ncbi:Mitogen-activated protein kinase kinase kinase kinase 5 [Echinococcus granulosus]|uniref:non-specific serine/threonine protein kinase n=1 Tax=Echinococcus granulosus TaxID=6210 RepID=W6UK59_ECHGR|nr:Mitogen-activated protein kinase kinase kinase kinase 5 [Echinococcus granulosus]EUB61433.1 Mitogen-activated protein kinase kinase kinase kinase 5 [Echinococcus granulosus]